MPPLGIPWPKVPKGSDKERKCCDIFRLVIVLGRMRGENKLFKCNKYAKTNTLSAKELLTKPKPVFV